MEVTIGSTETKKVPSTRPESDRKDDNEIRGKQFQDLDSSIGNSANRFTQGPDVNYDDTDPDTNQSTFLGDRRLSSEGTYGTVDAMHLARQDEKLWPGQESVAHVDLAFVAMDRLKIAVPSPDTSLSLEDEPATTDEVRAALTSLVKDFPLRTRRNQEIADRFTEDEVSQIRKRMRHNRAVEDLTKEELAMFVQPPQL